VFHPEWVGGRITTLTGALAKFGADPGVLVAAFGGAVLVQIALVLYYFAVAPALHLDIAFWDLAVVIPMSFVVQLLPVSVGGFGVREAFFSYYFHRIGQPIEDAVLLSLVAQALLMLFSLSGLATYLWRQRHPIAYGGNATIS
jgi:glycosyltransferase 2 family protein